MKIQEIVELMKPIDPFSIKMEKDDRFLIVFEDTTELVRFVYKSTALSVCRILNGAHHMGRVSILSQLSTEE